jgi:hypothetical protein
MGQKEEVGPTGIYPPGVPAPDDAEVLTPGDINSGHTGRRKHQEAIEPPDDAVKGAERLPRKGDELDDLKGEPTD